MQICFDFSSVKVKYILINLTSLRLEQFPFFESKNFTFCIEKANKIKKITKQFISEDLKEFQRNTFLKRKQINYFQLFQYSSPPSPSASRESMPTSS